MDCEFVQFCSCGRSGYSFLKDRIDTCAKSGRSYEFRHCRMLPNCVPVEATVGFWLHQGMYQIYFNPPVSYQGSDQRMSKFFSGGLLQFSTFEELVLRLMTLDNEPALTHQKPEPMPAIYHQIKHQLQSLVLGQEHAVEATAFKLYGHISKKSPTRPLSLIFYGPTGVGKSELGKGIAPVLNRLHGDYQFIWTELNTFTEPHSVYRLTGAPPGYVGYDDHPIFEAVRHNPKTVFMFDELEKAHPEVLKVFMSILDEGRCTAHREDPTSGRELNFQHCIFVFTTNADLSRGSERKLGFAASEDTQATLTISKPSDSCGPSQLAHRLFQEDESARQALIRTGVLKEIAGRFSGLIAFHELDHQARTAVTAKQIIALGREYGIQLTQVSPSIAEALTPDGALSLRSTVSVLEGVLTPLFLACANQARPEHAQFSLSGTVREPQLLELPVPNGYVCSM